MKLVALLICKKKCDVKAIFKNQFVIIICKNNNYFSNLYKNCYCIFIK